MKIYKSIFLSIVYVLSACLCSCSNEDEPMIAEAHNTIFMYLPWSGNLTNYFYQNVRDMESNICESGGAGNDRIIVFMSTSPSEADMYEIVYENGSCKHTHIRSYSNYPFTTEQGLTSLLQELKTYSPSKKYSMIIGCHGMGWLPVNSSRAKNIEGKQHYEYGNGDLMTRYFGGTTQEYQTDISSLANALANANMKMEYILFDDCYMSTIEVAYELKDVTDYLIASTCEVMVYGMPYATMGKHLLGTPNYKEICEEFYKFYSTYEIMPCGTLSVTDCSQLEEMANIMRNINSLCNFDEKIMPYIQRMDGYSPTIFFDYGDYVIKLLEANHADNELVSLFKRQLSLTVPFKTSTEKFFTASSGPLPIHTYSGITTSDPSTSIRASGKNTTKWYYATH